jgi:hypothetical protein
MTDEEREEEYVAILHARIAALETILDDWVKCAMSVEIRDYGQPGYEEAMKAFRKARRATYKYERECDETRQSKPAQRPERSDAARGAVLGASRPRSDDC